MSSTSPRMLVIAPHPDDEILGVGGTMARFTQAGGELTVLTVAAHMPPLYPKEVHEQTVAEAHQAHAVVGACRSEFLDYPAALMDDVRVPDFNRRIHEVVQQVAPDVLLIPYPDRHIDHRLIFDAAMVVSRPVGMGRGIKLVAAYETISETHWNAPHIEPNFTPNWVVDITDTIETKLAAMACYESQVHTFPQPRSVEALKALALFRGSQAGFGYGEGFHVIRMTAPPEMFIGG
ncbi:PIG-L deacetylase family protein [Aeoliella mucimassa]|uniref:1D-myo-inositol 2-acetamido-2-deoxy-alpha-D-glucopyranoside deacetylase n=1 Tax=Aeoliella mucimassa TaxID=2527972 RepID=A0A518AL26_9BACT|nr:PIG-L deacetylase family protein [Aeoliella mucimassa]QDU55384.1 1D-myo-inositol 2-acetamido-2-deoxy-alpha-D-glucopyranoside deacetylase [Aeoliella mucimassa]